MTSEQLHTVAITLSPNAAAILAQSLTALRDHKILSDNPTRRPSRDTNIRRKLTKLLQNASITTHAPPKSTRRAHTSGRTTPP